MPFPFSVTRKYRSCGLARATYPQGKNENIESQACTRESRAELFEVSYFDTAAYLAQSPQLFKQIVAAGRYDIPSAVGDLDPEAERRLSADIEETRGHLLVFVTCCDTSIRP